MRSGRRGRRTLYGTPRLYFLPESGVCALPWGASVQLQEATRHRALACRPGRERTQLAEAFEIRKRLDKKYHAFTSFGWRSAVALGGWLGCAPWEKPQIEFEGNHELREPCCWSCVSRSSRVVDTGHSLGATYGIAVASPAGVTRGTQSPGSALSSLEP